MKKKIYVIGGSPCGGKSTVAKEIAKEFGLRHFEADEYFEVCVRKAAADGKKQAIRQATIYGTEKWRKNPVLQTQEELALYREVFPYMLEEFEKIETTVIAEGVVFLPELVQEAFGEDIPYVCMIPKPMVQRARYKERTWVWEVVKICESPKQAFCHWMERDVLFGQYVGRTASQRGIPVFYTDDTISIREQKQKILDILGVTEGKLKKL